MLKNLNFYTIVFKINEIFEFSRQKSNYKYLYFALENSNILLILLEFMDKKWVFAPVCVGWGVGQLLLGKNNPRKKSVTPHLFCTISYGIFNWFRIYDQSSPEFLSCATKIGHNLFSDKFFLGTIPSDISIFSATDVKRKKQMPRRSNFRLNEPHKPSPNQPDDFSALGTATPHSKTWAFFRIYC